MPRRRAASATIAAIMTLAAPIARAVPDEIQVYTDDINAPREFGLELHLNATPKGRTTPDFPGDLPTQGSYRATAEFSYGLPHDFEAGLYLPTVTDSHGNFSAAGVKLRLKWIPLRPEEGESGWYAGANLELANVNKKFSESQWSTELRLILGYHTEDWFIGGNIILDQALSQPYRSSSPDTTLALKANHRVAGNAALGLEYYDDIGTLSHTLPRNQQGQVLYLTLDYAGKVFDINFGVGRGLNNATDAWTVKAIIGFPLN